MTRTRMGRPEAGRSAGPPAKPARGNRKAADKSSDRKAPVNHSLHFAGATFREQRRRLNLTLEEVAGRVGITKGFLSEVERDRASPSVATLMRLREALSISVASLFISSQPRLVRAKERQEVYLGGRKMS